VLGFALSFTLNVGVALRLDLEPDELRHILSASGRAARAVTVAVLLLIVGGAIVLLLGR